MAKNFLIRPLNANMRSVVATNEGWLGLRDNKREPTELLVSHKGLFDKLKELDQLLEIDLEYNGVVTTEASPEPVELTPLDELIDYTEELLQKYPKKDLIDFVKSNNLGKPKSGDEAIKILITLQG